MSRARPLVPLTPERRAALTPLYAGYHRLVRKVAKEYRLDDQDTEDFVQTVFLNLVHYDRFDPTRRALMSTFVARVARNVAILLWKHRNRTCRKPPGGAVVSFEDLADDGYDPAAPESPDPEAAAADLDELLASLSLTERLVVLARFRDDLTLQETGDRLHLSRERIRQIQITALMVLSERPEILSLMAPED